MINKINSSNAELKLVLTAKDGFSRLNLEENKEIWFDGFLNPVTILKNHAHNQILKHKNFFLISKN